MFSVLAFECNYHVNIVDIERLYRTGHLRESYEPIPESMRPSVDRYSSMRGCLARSMSWNRRSVWPYQSFSALLASSQQLELRTKPIQSWIHRMQEFRRDEVSSPHCYEDSLWRRRERFDDLYFSPWPNNASPVVIFFRRSVSRRVNCSWIVSTVRLLFAVIDCTRFSCISMILLDNDKGSSGVTARRAMAWR